MLSEILLSSKTWQQSRIHKACVPKNSLLISGLESASNGEISDKPLILSETPPFLTYKMEMIKYNLVLCVKIGREHEV